MKTHYQLAVEFLRNAEECFDREDAALMVAHAQVHATLALVDVAGVK